MMIPVSQRNVHAQNHAEFKFLLGANILGLGKGGRSGLSLDDSPLRGVTTATAAAGADGVSRGNHSCENLLRGDRGTPGSR